MVRGHLGHRHHKRRSSFHSQSCKEGSQQNCCLDFQGADFGLFTGMVGSVPWDVVPRGQGSAGRLNIVRESNLTGAGAGYPHVLKEAVWEEDWPG